jgi:hypothetical protein
MGRSGILDRNVEPSGKDEILSTIRVGRKRGEERSWPGGTTSDVPRGVKSGRGIECSNSSGSLKQHLKRSDNAFSVTSTGVPKFKLSLKPMRLQDPGFKHSQAFCRDCPLFPYRCTFLLRRRPLLGEGEYSTVGSWLSMRIGTDCPAI